MITPQNTPELGPDRANARATTRATIDATDTYCKRFANLPGNYRRLGSAADGLLVSSLGLGTYLGRDEEGDDDLYREAILSALQAGVNLIDTAINYRAQRSERTVGAALSKLSQVGLCRDQVVVCTKAGFLPFDGTVPRDGGTWLRRTYLDSGLCPKGTVVQGCHCIDPTYLADQLQRSLRNLRLSTLDVFYLHNPETQLAEVDRQEFESRIRAAFTFLEQACDKGEIVRYGCATWNGFRKPPSAPDHLDLPRLVAIAKEIAGDQHHFRVIQLPINLAMTEAISLPTQPLSGRLVPVLAAAEALGISVVASGPLLQGKILSRPLPQQLVAPFPEFRRDSQRALQFVRSVQGVTSVLCGMKSQAHLKENLAILGTPPLTPQAFHAAFPEP